MFFVTAWGNKSDGYPQINLDHVALLLPVRKDGKLEGYDCIDTTGECLGRIGDYELPEEPEVIVPDSTGANVISGYLHEGFVYLTTDPVIAWRISKISPKFGAIPILVHELNELYVMEVRGKYYADFEGWFDSKDEAIEYLKSKIQKKKC